MPFLRTGGKRDHAARARGHAGGGAMFLGMGGGNMGVKLFCQPMIFFFLLFCSDSLTLVTVFSLFTHCNKYRIYFSIIEGGPGEPPPGTISFDM